MKRTLLVLLLALPATAQHVEYFSTRHALNAVWVSPAYRDSKGRLVLLEEYVVPGFGPPASQPTGFFAVGRYTEDFQERVSWNTPLKVAAGAIGARSPAASRLDRFDRLYLGGATRDGKPWLSREDGWQMQVPSMTGRVVAIDFDTADDPVALVVSSVGASLWRADRESGAITRSLDFGRPGQLPTALMRKETSFFITSGASLFAVDQNLTNLQFETKLSGDTQLNALSVGAHGVFVAGSTVSRAGAEGFATTPGVFLPDAPSRMPADNPIAIVARLNPSTGAIEAATYLGGSRKEEARGLVADASGVYVLGMTSSRDFPLTGAFRAPCGPDHGPFETSSFVTKVNQELTEVVRSATFSQVSVPFLPELLNGQFLLNVGGKFGRLEMDRNDESTVTCMVSGASYWPQAGQFGSRELITLFGQGLGPKDPLVYEGKGLRRLPREAGGTEVVISGVPAPLLAVLDTQINFMAPEFPLTVPAPLEVRRNGATIFRGVIGIVEGPTPVTLVRVTPTGAIGFSGSLIQADAVNEDGTPNSASNPAPPGSVLSVFFTGTGSLSDPAPDDDIAGETPATPSQFRYLIETKREFIEPESVTTQVGRNKGVLQVRWRLPDDASGLFGFQVRVKTFQPVRYGLSHFVFVR